MISVGDANSVSSVFIVVLASCFCYSVISVRNANSTRYLLTVLVSVGVSLLFAVVSEGYFSYMFAVVSEGNANSASCTRWFQCGVVSAV